MIDDIADKLAHKKSVKMDKFTKHIESLVRNQENIMSSLLVIDRRIQVILNSQLTLNEAVTKVSNGIEILTIQKNQNSNAIATINLKI